MKKHFFIAGLFVILLSSCESNSIDKYSRKKLKTGNSVFVKFEHQLNLDSLHSLNDSDVIIRIWYQNIQTEFVWELLCINLSQNVSELKHYLVYVDTNDASKINSRIIKDFGSLKKDEILDIFKMSNLILSTSDTSCKQALRYDGSLLGLEVFAQGNHKFLCYKIPFYKKDLNCSNIIVANKIYLFFKQRLRIFPASTTVI